MKNLSVIQDHEEPTAYVNVAADDAKEAAALAAVIWLTSKGESVKCEGPDLEHLKKVFGFAISIGKLPALVRALDQATFPTFFGKPSYTQLTKEEPTSFYFMIYIKGTEDKWVMNGGVIFHEAWRDGERVPNEGEWSVHT